jgi:hypothetical protein
MEKFETLFCPSKFQWARERSFLIFIDTLGTHSQEVRQPFVRHWLGLLGWSVDMGLVDGLKSFGGTYRLHLQGTLKIEAATYL